VCQECGPVTAAHSNFTCPTGSVFEDYNGGSFGDFAKTSLFVNWDSNCRVLTSLLQFQCSQCPKGTYTLERGFSSGEPRDAYNVLCLPCPDGGTCDDDAGTMVAQAGHWGVATRVFELVPDHEYYGTGHQQHRHSSDATNRTGLSVVFGECPQGYCCTGDASTPWPCDGIDRCAHGRTGALCGACPPGHGNVFGSTECVSAAACEDRMVAFWASYAALLELAAVFVLVKSGVWTLEVVERLLFTKQQHGFFSLFAYFAQVRAGHGDVTFSLSTPLLFLML
jgi:hypothetical protein